MITDRDKLILKFIETYRYVTIEILQKIFFKEQQNSYNLVRRRLGEIKRAGYIKIHRDIETNRNIYIWNDEKIKPPSRHRIILLNVLAELYHIGCNVEYFDIEKQSLNGAIRSDAFTVFSTNDRRYHFFVEVHISNNICNLDKYDTLYKSGEVQEYLHKNIYPRVLLISDSHYDTSKLKYTKCIKLNTKLNMFSTILLTKDDTNNYSGNRMSI